MKKLGLLVMTVVFVFALSGCETMKGLGKDMQNAGKALEREAE